MEGLASITEWLAHHKDALQAVGALGFLVSAFVAVCTFLFSTYSTRKANRRAELTVLAKMYADWNSDIVKNEDVRAVKKMLVWDHLGFNDEQIKKIHFVHQSLSILLVEWNIAKNYRHKSDAREAKSSLRGVLGGINEQDRRFFVENFDAMFLGYPEEFKRALRAVLEEAPLLYRTNAATPCSAHKS